MTEGVNVQIKRHYKTIVISDVHLGTKDSKAKEVYRFLKKTTCDLLLLNGDIIDGWQLKRGSKWKKKHTRFIRLVLKVTEKYNTKVVYCRGNHDDFLDNILPLDFDHISIVKDYIYQSNNKRFWVVHGDIFDSITTNMKWLAKLGDIGYSLLLWFNKIYNERRIKKGLPYYSLAKEIKQKVKKAVSYISSFERELVNLAKDRHFDGIICGHIHHPSIDNYNSVMYLNSGDWVESMSALVEDYSGTWKIIYYTDFIQTETEVEALSNHS